MPTGGDLTHITNRGVDLANGGGFDLEILPGGRYWLVLNGQTLFGLDSQASAYSFGRSLSTYSTTAWPLDVAAGDLQDVVETVSPWANEPSEIVVATRTGYVTWLSVARLFTNVDAGNVILAGQPPLGIGFLTPIALDMPNNTYRQPGVANAAPAYSSRSTAATLAMTPTEGLTNSLEVIDQAGSRWRVNTITGDLTFLHELRQRIDFVVGTQPHFANIPMAGPILGVAYVGDPAPGALAPDPWLSVADFTAAVPGVAASAKRITTWPFTPDYGELTPYPNYGFGVWENDKRPQHLQVYDGYLVFPHGGDTNRSLDVSGPPAAGPVWQAHWWSGSDEYEAWPNLVEGAYFDHTNPASVAVAEWWATSRHINGGFGSGLPPSAIAGNDLRDGFLKPLAQADAQSIRVFWDDVAQKTFVAVATAGGSAIVLDPASRNQISPLFSESEDFGNGGMGLAVARAVNPGSPPTEENMYADVYLGVLTYHGAFAQHSTRPPGSTGADDAVGAVIWLEWTGTALAKHDVRILDGLTLDNPKAYGVCGLALGDAIRNNGSQELVVGTLDGQLLVFARDAQGHVGSLLYRTQLEGSIGAFNSIVVADLDAVPTAPGNEIYVAGSLGLRKFIQQ